MIALILLLLALVGMPLFAVIALGALAGFQHLGLDGRLLIMEFLYLGETPLLLSVPLFVFTGVLLAESNALSRLALLGRSLFGARPAGLAASILVLCALGVAFSGAPGVVMLALGALLLPTLAQTGLDARDARGLLAASTVPGVLVAPALPLILYAMISSELMPAGVESRTLLLAGIFPAVLMLALITLYAARACRGSPAVAVTLPPGRAFRQAAWELPLPLGLCGGLYSGWLLLTEAALLAAAWTLLVACVVRREVTWRRLPKVISESMMLAGAVLLIVGMVMAAAGYLVSAGWGLALFDWVVAHIGHRLIFVLLLAILLPLIGSLFNPLAAVAVLTPLLLPAASAVAIDPVHFGIVLVAGVQIGRCLRLPGRWSPIVGTEPPTASGMTPVLLLLLIVGWLLIGGWPALSLWLPGH